MTKEHAIRLCISHYSGAERERWKEHLLKNPYQIPILLKNRIKRLRQKRWKNSEGPRKVTLAVRLLPEEYLHIKSMADTYKLSVSAYVRKCCFIKDMKV